MEHFDVVTALRVEDFARALQWWRSSERLDEEAEAARRDALRDIADDDTE